jgi:hypothetical protein
VSEAWLDEFYAYVTCFGVDSTLAPGCGSVGLTQEQYLAQLSCPDYGWRCPQCGGDADFDDTKFEELHPE